MRRTTIQDYIDGMDEMIRSIESEFPKVMVSRAAKDIQTMVVNRVSEEGINYKGDKFSSYSTDPTYINTTDNSPKKLPPRGKTGRTVFAKTGKKHKTTYFGGGYREFRGKIGRSTNKDFFLTGEMWRKFGIKRVEQNDGVVTVVLGGTTPEVQDKIDGNTKREGISLIEPTNDEIAIVESAIQDWLDGLSNQTFN